VLIGLGVSGSGFTAVFGVIARAAPPEKRTLALSIASMGSAVGQFIALPFVHVLLTDTGWVMTLLILAGVAAIMAPLGFMMSMRLREDGANGTTPPPVIDTQTIGPALREAMTYPSFILLTLGFFVCGFQLAAVATHLPAFIGDKGFDPSLGVIALTVVGLTNIAGTYLCGRAGEIMPKKVALTLIYVLRAVIFIGLLYLPLSEGLIIAMAAALGFLWLGTIPLTSGLIVTFFGPRWLSMLYGIVFLSHQIGSFLGAWLGGLVFDVYQSYDMLWWMSVAVSLLAALFHLPIREAASPRLEDAAKAAAATA
jgi:predicted MFS family arabinose efflux permease